MVDDCVSLPPQNGRTPGFLPLRRRPEQRPGCGCTPPSIFMPYRLYRQDPRQISLAARFFYNSFPLHSLSVVLYPGTRTRVPGISTFQAAQSRRPERPGSCPECLPVHLTHPAPGPLPLRAGLEHGVGDARPHFQLLAEHRGEERLPVGLGHVGVPEAVEGFAIHRLPEDDDAREEGIRIFLQRHLDDAAGERGGALVNPSDLPEQLDGVARLAVQGDAEGRIVSHARGRAPAGRRPFAKTREELAKFPTGTRNVLPLLYIGRNVQKSMFVVRL